MDDALRSAAGGVLAIDAGNSKTDVAIIAPDGSVRGSARGAGFRPHSVGAEAAVDGLEAIIGEGPGGISEGLGRLIITFNQYYITGPEKLWAAIGGTALLGIAFFVLIVIVEWAVLRNRRKPELA